MRWVATMDAQVTAQVPVRVVAWVVQEHALVDAKANALPVVGGSVLTLVVVDVKVHVQWLADLLQVGNKLECAPLNLYIGCALNVVFFF